MPGSIRVERYGPVASILFDHPERRSAITAAIWREIPVVARELRISAIATTAGGWSRRRSRSRKPTAGR